MRYTSSGKRARGGSCEHVGPNNSFKPNLLRYSKGMAEKACHTSAFTTQVGLTQALAPYTDFAAASPVLVRVQ